jgi:hypothetical protein
MENFRKKNDTESQNTWKATTPDYKKKTESQNLKIKVKIKGKAEELLVKTSRSVKGICNHSPTQSKVQT